MDAPRQKELIIKKQKLLVILLVCIYALTSLPAVANATTVSNAHSNELSADFSFGNVPGTVFENGKIFVVENFNESINDLSFTFNGTIATASFSTSEIQQPVSFSVDIVPTSGIGGGYTEWIGIPTEESADLHIVSFRIEEECDTITLLAPNLSMAGHCVVSLGIQLKSNTDIIYFQVIADSFVNYLTQLYSATTTDASKLAEANELRTAYYRLSSSDHASCCSTSINDTPALNVSSVEMSEPVYEASASGNYTDMAEYLSQLPVYSSHMNSASTRSVINNINDYIFKSGDVEVWHKDNVTGVKQMYCYIAYNYAGTLNRETHIMVLDWVTNALSDQNYLQSLRVLNNSCVIYNVNTGLLGINSACLNPVIARNAYVQINVNNTDSGVIIKRHQYANVSGSTYMKIAKCIVQWIPYASTVLSNYETLTGTRANEIEAYQGTWNLQKASYGYTIYSVKAETSYLRYVNDIVYIEVWCNGAQSYSYYRNYTPDDI